MAETTKTEVLVVGAGAAGIPAAIGAAGVGAAISVRQKRAPRDLDPKDLQKILKTRKQGKTLLASEISG